MTAVNDEILVCGNTFYLQDILDNRAVPPNNFASSCFEFIREWCSTREKFDFHTSGSTGIPKILSFSREQIRKSAERTMQSLGMAPGNSVLVCLEATYVAGKMMILRALEGKMKLILVEPSSDPLSDIHEHIDFVSLVPLQIRAILSNEASKSKLDTFKGILVGGAPISKALDTAIKTVVAPVYATYGMTETLSNIAMRRLNGPAQQESFTVMEGVSVAQDERGCLIVKDSLTGIEVTTNDLAELTTSTSFKILGRFDNIINTGGHKISPEAVESAAEESLRSAGITSHIIVSFIEDEKLGQKVVLLVEGGVEADDQQLLKIISEGLHPYERPKKVIRLNKFAYTSNGKVNRERTRELLLKN